MFTFIHLRTGKTFESRQITNKAAVAEYLSHRRAEIDADLRASGKQIVNLKYAIDANGGYECRPAKAPAYRFALSSTQMAIPTYAGREYQDATQADWQSGKFHR